MIAIGNGECCPFCQNDKFIMEKDKDFLKHLTETHPEEFEKYLFGGEDIGV